MSADAPGLLDASAVVDLELLDPAALPAQLSIGAPTLAELAARPHATDDLVERAARQARLQWAETQFSAIPFDAAAARAYMIVVTRKADDFAGLDDLVELLAV